MLRMNDRDLPPLWIVSFPFRSVGALPQPGVVACVAWSAETGGVLAPATPALERARAAAVISHHVRRGLPFCRMGVFALSVWCGDPRSSSLSGGGRGTSRPPPPEWL